MLRKLIVAGVFAGLSMSAAHAADVDVAPGAYDWTGFYLGAQVGYGWGDFDTDITINGERQNMIAPGGDFDGIVGGGHVGYNIQFNQFVLGVEGDLEASGMNGSDTWGVEGEDIDVGLTGSLRARAGFAFDRAMLYATAGLAGADIDYTTTVQNHSSGNDVTYWGYTVGGGIEYAFTESLSGRLEYRYTDLGSESFNPKTLSCLPTDCEIESDVAFQSVRAGITWHWGAF